MRNRSVGIFAAGREATARALQRASYTIMKVVAPGGHTVVGEQTITGPIVWIADENVGKSVTNDAERVVAELSVRYPGYRIIYRDTDGKWDELLHKDGVFIDFLPARHLSL